MPSFYSFTKFYVVLFSTGRLVTTFQMFRIAIFFRYPTSKTTKEPKSHDHISGFLLSEIFKIAYTLSLGSKL
jgi:hypothetical protein